MRFQFAPSYAVISPRAVISLFAPSFRAQVNATPKEAVSSRLVGKNTLPVVALPVFVEFALCCKAIKM
jgi:hypothetical protein